MQVVQSLCYPHHLQMTGDLLAFLENVILILWIQFLPAQARAAWQWEKSQSRNPFPHTLQKTKSFLKKWYLCLIWARLILLLVTLPLCLTLSRANHTPKVCSGSSVYLCVAAQEPTPYNIVFLNKQELFPAGLWDTFLDLHGAVCVKLYHSSTVWILSSDYQLFEYSKWVLQAALIYQHSSLVNISSLSELVFIFLPLFKRRGKYSLNLFCVLRFWWS